MKDVAGTDLSRHERIGFVFLEGEERLVRDRFAVPGGSTVMGHLSAALAHVGVCKFQLRDIGESLGQPEPRTVAVRGAKADGGRVGFCC